MGNGESSTRSTWVGVAVVLGVLLLVVGLSFVLTRDRREDKPSRTALPTPLFVRGNAAHVASGASPPPPQSAGATRMAGGGTQPQAQPGEVEICGIGMLPAAVAEHFQPDAQMQANIAAARRRVIDAMTGQANERSRVAGLLLQRAADIEAAAKDRDLDIKRRCGDDKTCTEAAEVDWLAPYKAGLPAGEKIATAALTTSDPAVYAAAVEACADIGMRGKPPSCEMISAQQWARLEPSNAVAWLHVAGEAARRKDDAAVAEAMYHVAQAKTSRLHTEIVSLAQPYMDEVQGYERIDLDMLTLSSLASWSLPSYLPVSKYCSAELLADSNRWQMCDALTKHLINTSSTLIEYRIGIRIAERLKWPQEEIVALRQHSDAMSQAMMTTFSSQSTSCLSIERLRRRILTSAKLGEQGAARAAIAASGKSEEVLASEMRIALQPAVGAASKESRLASSASDQGAASGPTPYSATPPPAR